ncbi:MAG TPA: hypothetical protein VFQ77_13025, partial [Pseudonocardiaceae bacterium]|nr:hypothetical protein [Pseudonocardiaceae bacterium]
MPAPVTTSAAGPITTLATGRYGAPHHTPHRRRAVTMSYGHGPHLARSAQQHSAQQTPPPGPPPQSRTPATPDTLAPDWYTAPELAPILTGRDIRGLYR